MSDDISYLLQQWEYNPENTVRLIIADDGRQVMQLRLPLGIEQYELDGRPDGERPFGKHSVLEEIIDRCEEFVAEHLEDGGFSIDHDDFVLLQNETILFYYRYSLLFALGDFDRTERDTSHNLEICSLVEKYCTNKEDQKSLLQYKPYIMRMNALSKSMIHLNLNHRADALETIENAINIINSMPEVDTPQFQFQRIKSLSSLRSTLKELKKQDVSELDVLQSELSQAVEEENYERAAELRDQILGLEDNAAE